eukprot:jgi/Mesen1/10327/ME000797S09811
MGLSVTCHLALLLLLALCAAVARVEGGPLQGRVPGDNSTPSSLLASPGNDHDRKGGPRRELLQLPGEGQVSRHRHHPQQPDPNSRAEAGAQNGSGATSGPGRSAREVVCWNSPAIGYGGLPPGSAKEAQLAPQGSPKHRVKAFGEGCARCRAGATCHFRLHFTSGAYFDTNKTIMREMMVALTGPTALHARVVPHRTLDGRRTGVLSYLVSYRAWDAGIYNLTVTSDCSLAPGGTEPASHVLVSFQVAVGEGASRATKEGGDGDRDRVSSSSELAQSGAQEVLGGAAAGMPRRTLAEDMPGGMPAEEEVPGGSGALTPCQVGEWVLAPKESPANVTWVFKLYSCAEGNFLLPKDFPGRLAEKGVRVVDVRKHGDTVWDFVDPRTRARLRLNFYWVDGVFRNGEFGCAHRGLYSRRADTFPAYSPDSDVVVSNAGAWSFAECVEPERAYRARLPEFLEWQVSRPHKATTRFLWRSQPPFPVPYGGCAGRRNSALAWANDFARSECAKYGMGYVDVWPIEAPRYRDTCYQQAGNKWLKDHHYTCQYADFTKVHGDVGEAGVRHFMHALVHLYLA